MSPLWQSSLIVARWLVFLLVPRSPLGGREQSVMLTSHRGLFYETHVFKGGVSQHGCRMKLCPPFSVCRATTSLDFPVHRASVIHAC